MQRPRAPAGLPDEDLRNHDLAAAIRLVERMLAEHGYAEPDRALEVLHVAVEDALDYSEDVDDALDEVAEILGLDARINSGMASLPQLHDFRP